MHRGIVASAQKVFSDWTRFFDEQNILIGGTKFHEPIKITLSSTCYVTLFAIIFVYLT